MWYLHSWCHLRGEHRDFALPRIQALTVLALTFTPPSSAEVDARLAMRFSGVAGEAMDVAVLFDPAEARRIRERLWHPSQRIDDHPDGTCTLFLHTEGLPTLVRWVLSFGSHARVLAPPELAEAVWAEVKAMEAALREFGLGNNAQVH
jgi:predicted DNA-binding transcriptional regulator YafY